MGIPKVGLTQIVRNRVIASTGKLHNEVDWSSPDMIGELTGKGVDRVVNV